LRLTPLARSVDLSPLNINCMTLSDLGFDPWFEDRIGEGNRAGRGIARISAVDRGSYLIRNEAGEVPAEIARRRYVVA
jgi:hypothetical protein